VSMFEDHDDAELGGVVDAVSAEVVGAGVGVLVEALRLDGIEVAKRGIGAAHLNV
jgi:hypothetical protein